MPYAQGRVGTAAIVTDHPLKKDAAEVAFAQRNEEAEALAPNGSNEPFAESICLRATNRCFQDADIEPGQFMVQTRREDGIPVMNEKSVRMVAGQRGAAPSPRLPPLERPASRTDGDSQTKASLVHGSGPRAFELSLPIQRELAAQE
jgi:hypothetical protein